MNENKVLDMLDEASGATYKNDVEEAIANLNDLSSIGTVEVELPILQCRAVISPIVGNDDLIQKTLKTTGYNFIKTFNELLLKNTKFEGIDFESLEDFEKHLSASDKMIIIHGLLDATYSTLPEKLITCPHCKKQNPYTFTPSDMVHEDTYKKQWSHDEDFTEYRATKTIIDGFDIVYKMGTEDQKLKLLKNKSTQQLKDDLQDVGGLLNNLELITLYIDKIIIGKGKNKKIYSDDKKIIDIINGMAADLKTKVIEDQTINEFLEYAPNYYLNVFCKDISCSKEFNWYDIDPETDFFRKSVSIY